MKKLLILGFMDFEISLNVTPEKISKSQNTEISN